LEFIDILREQFSWEQISFIATIINAGIAFLVWVTSFRQIREMRSATEESNRAYIVVYYEVPRPNIVQLVVENMGNSLAKDVKFEMDPPIQVPQGGSLSDTKLSDTNLSDTNLFKNGIPNLPPKSRISIYVGSFPGDENRKIYESTVQVIYNGWKKSPYKETYHLSLDHYARVRRLKELTIHDLAKSFDEFAKQMKKNESKKIPL
jgi:hypothetical protein